MAGGNVLLKGLNSPFTPKVAEIGLNLALSDMYTEAVKIPRPRNTTQTPIIHTFFFFKKARVMRNVI